jgi:transcription initiation factor TFIIIB Brf1 subunit/transcription initiation factor TFIIB
MESDLVTQAPKTRAFRCDYCGNEDEGYVVRDDNQGTMICMGSDGLGCGCVITENTYYQEPEQLIQTSELYSDQDKFMTGKIRHRMYNRLSKLVEKNLSRFGKENTVTCDYYKDEMRRKVYELVDEVQRMCDVSSDVADSVKYMFHAFRDRMMRVHDLRMLVCCLFYLNLS